MNKRKLTDTFIRNLEAPEKRTEYYDEVVTGMILRITPTGYKSFALRYWYDEESKQYTIGKYEDWTLADARKKARELKQLVNDGIDPIKQKEERKKTEAPKTFKELAEEFKAVHMKPLRQSTKDEYTRIIDNELVPALGKYPAKDIDRGQIISLLDKKGITDGKATMANRLRARLHSIFEFGIHRTIVKKNPVTGVKPYPEGEIKRERYYSEKELRHLWKAFEQVNQPAQSVFKMLLLTGQRKTETMKVRWKDLNSDVWTIPANLAKGKRSHDVPLPDMAMEIIETMKLINSDKAHVFSSPVLEDNAIQEIKRSIKKVREYTEDDFCVKDFRLHDLRRTAATYMAKLNTDRTVLGKILNHKGLSGDGQVTAIYDRHSYMKEKRQALQRWANHLKQIVSGQEAKIHKIG